MLREVHKILHDITHTLICEFEMLPSDQRLESELSEFQDAELNRFKNEFIRFAIKLLNKTMYGFLMFQL